MSPVSQAAGVSVHSDGKRVALLLGGAALLDLFFLYAGPAALGAHLAAVWLAWRVARAGSSRTMVTALVVALPLGGAVIAVVALLTRGRATDDREPEEAVSPAMITAVAVRRESEALAAADVIVSGDGEARREVLAALVERGDGESVALLHWALDRADPELALEAALALEGLEAEHASRVVAGRAALAELGTFEAALALADTLSESIHSGFTQGTLALCPAAEARNAYALAASLDGARASLAAEHLALLELAARRPGAALAVVELLCSSSPTPELETLRSKVYLAARQKSAFPRLRGAA